MKRSQKGRPNAGGGWRAGMTVFDLPASPLTKEERDAIWADPPEPGGPRIGPFAKVEMKKDACLVIGLRGTF